MYLIKFKKNVRNCLDQKVDLARGLNELASTNGKRTVYGFHSIFQISKRLPLLWVFVPTFWLFKISGLGDLIYTEFAQKEPLSLFTVIQTVISQQTVNQKSLLTHPIIIKNFTNVPTTMIV